jgi:hypothetical protein
MVALFAIVIASSLITLNVGFGGSAFAATARRVTLQNQDNAHKTLLNDKSNFQSQSADAGDSIGPTGKASGISVKDLRNLLKCESSAAADGELTSAEAVDCYRQVFRNT